MFILTTLNQDFFPNILYANVRSINNKLDELRLFISDKHYDIVSITESWLTPEILDCTVNLPNFVVNRDDRHTKIGGGVCVWLNSSISYDRFYPSIEKPCDIESVFLILKNYSIIFITVYIPPGLNMTKYNAINEFLIAAIDEVLSVLPDLKVVLTGDFNRAPVNNLCVHCDLHPIIMEATRGNACLDQIFVHFDMKSNIRYEIGCPFGKSDHKSISAHSAQLKNNSNLKSCLVRDFRRSKIDAFVNDVSTIDFDTIYCEI